MSGSTKRVKFAAKAPAHGLPKFPLLKAAIAIWPTGQGRKRKCLGKAVHRRHGGPVSIGMRRSRQPSPGG